MSRERRAWRLEIMRHQSIDRLFGVEAALRELFRDVVREELRYLRGEVLGWLEEQGRQVPPLESAADELLTVAQVARDLQAVPGTIRSWIESGALKSSRPGNGKQPGRTYRVRRAVWMHSSPHPNAGVWRGVAVASRRLAVSRRLRTATKTTAR